MNEPTKPPVILRFPGRSPDDLDGLLHRFFRAQMPEPWPAWAPPEARQPSRPRPAGRQKWLAVRRRLVLAASVALLLVGYLALARSYPGMSESVGPAVSPDFGKLPGVPKGDRNLLPKEAQPGNGPQLLGPKTVPVPRGGQAKLWEQHFPGRVIAIQVQDIPSAKLQR